MIQVNGLNLPASFEQETEEIRQRSGTASSWRLKEDVDAYGNFWETSLDLYGDVEKIRGATGALEGYENADHLFADSPGFVPFIDDFSKIVWIGQSGAGEDFCLDFRENKAEPSVIYWADGYWRRVAPNFETFIDLFKPADSLDEDGLVDW